MAFDTSGTFTRLRGNDSWKGDATAGTKIQANLHDNNDNDIANGLSECLNRNAKGTPLADMPWGGYKITNLGTPTQPSDAATKNYVDVLPGWETSKNIGGADLNGRLNFTGPSGVNGITWTYADLSWVARHSVAAKYPSYLTLNSGVAPNTTGDPAGDVFIIDEVGRINNVGTLSYNLSFESAKIRTISPGTGTRINYTNGMVSFGSNDVASITNKYAEVTLRNFFTAQNATGSTFVYFDKSASGKYNRISASMAGKNRWVMDLGNATPETATERVGSDFALYSYNNAGTVAFAELLINRANHIATFGGNVSSAQAIGTTNVNAIFHGSGSTGALYLRPRGVHDTACEVVVNGATGALVVSDTGLVQGGKGYNCRAGALGGYSANVFNFLWDGTYVKSYIDNAFVGNIMWQASDYRIKRDIQPLPSMWDKVKALSPISWKQKAYDIYQDNDAPRWGFVAHELQERLGDHAASGVKDGPDVQTVDLAAVVTALTKALQEAMARIEALEAAA